MKTKEEIIKALKYCIDEEKVCETNGNVCPYETTCMDCTDRLMKDVIELLESQET